MKNLIFITLVLGLMSCSIPEKNEAKGVQKIKGLYVFVMSEPKIEFEPLGFVSNNVANQYKEATSGEKKFTKILEGIVSTTARNVDFQQVINNMAEMAKQEYPDAEALIFDQSLSRARVVKFRLLYPNSY